VALTVWDTFDDRVGVSLRCDAPGCGDHISLTPAGRDPSARFVLQDMVDTVAGWAVEDGWRLGETFGASWCPVHSFGPSRAVLAPLAAPEGVNPR
jgi:hypothetical protein